MREAMQLVLQDLIDLEATQVIGAAHYERNETRTTHRNGSPHVRSPPAARQIIEVCHEGSAVTVDRLRPPECQEATSSTLSGKILHSPMFSRLLNPNLNRSCPWRGYYLE